MSRSVRIRCKTLLFLSLVAVLCLVPAVRAGDHRVAAQYDSLDRTKVVYDLDTFAPYTVEVEGKPYLSLFLDGEGLYAMDQAGHPRVPSVCRSVMIPDDARMAVEVVKAAYHDVEDVDLISYRGPIPRTVDPASVPYTFGEVYQKDAWYPGDVASLRAPYILHDVRGVTVELHPFQYNPVKRVLRVYTHLEAEVKRVGKDTTNVLDRSVMPKRPSRSFERIYEDLFLNYGDNRTEPPSEDGEMLVISDGAFLSAIQPLVDWKNSIGIPTTLVDVATIGNNATSIKNYIKSVYNTSNLSYVLLVGDSNEVKSGSYAGGLSDPYYSTLTSDWYPDVFVGRFSAQTTAQVDTQVERTIAYEQQGHDLSMGDWNTWGMGIGSAQGAGQGHYGEADYVHIGKIRDELLSYGFSKVDEIYDPYASKSQVSSGLNQGRRVVNYCGHGSTTSWGTTGFSNSDVNKLTNEGMLPFICSVACVNGAFGGTTCFAEAWLRATHNGKPTGAVACYMSSINQSWAPPMYAEGNHAKNGKYGAAERFWKEINHSVAGLWYGGSCTMMDIVGSSGREMFMTWIIFGDPSLRILGSTEPPTLIADGSQVPLDNPVTITFTVCPGPDYAGENYILLGGVSGTDPGTNLPGGLHVPLNFDALTYYIIANPNTPVFQNFLGTLDGNGEAQAVFSTNGLTPLDPGLANLKIYFCGVIWPSGGAYSFATNVKTLTLVR